MSKRHREIVIMSFLSGLVNRAFGTYCRFLKNLFRAVGSLQNRCKPEKKGNLKEIMKNAWALKRCWQRFDSALA